MSAVMNQNIKEDFEEQINEYYSNYNLYNSVEHFQNAQLDSEEQAEMDADLNNASNQNGSNNRRSLQDNQLNNRRSLQDNQLNNSINVEFKDQMTEIRNNVNNNPELGISNKCKDYFNNKKALMFEQGTNCLDEYTTKIFSSMEDSNGQNMNLNQLGTNRNLQQNNQGILNIKNNIQKACDVFNNNYNN
jgi:hypothetical protein